MKNKTGNYEMGEPTIAFGLAGRERDICYMAGIGHLVCRKTTGKMTDPCAIHYDVSRYPPPSSVVKRPER